MKTDRLLRAMKVLAPGMLLLQIGGCDPVAFNEFVQTVLLGITAAGSIAILQNI